MPTKTRKPHALYCDDPSLTVQASKEECDINKILSRFQQGQDLTHVESRVARYGDFSQVPSYQEALDLVLRAKSMFMEMSPAVRDRFNNDPGKMVAFLQNPENREEAIKLGLVVPPPVDKTPADQKPPIPAAVVPAENNPVPPAAAPGSGS